MKIKNFLFYFYYRVCQWYDGPTQADGPVDLIISFNISVIVNILLYLYALMGPSSGLESLNSIMLVVDFASFFITICTIKIYLFMNTEHVNQQFELFKNETPSERKKHGREMWIYMVVSVLALVFTYVIS